MSRIALHAATLVFAHPATGKRMHWKCALPGDMMALVQRLRAQLTKPGPSRGAAR
jgi:hypothetical protein